MSGILVAGEQLNKSQINSSPTKQMYSFSRDNRFRKGRTSSMSESNFYELPPVRSMRYTTLGKGERTDFAKINKKACEQFYDLPSFFNAKKPIGNAFSFGISRDYYKKVFCTTNKYFEKNNPGPGKYEITKRLGTDAPKFSFYSKLENKVLKSNANKIPGPGEYNPPSFNPEGKYQFSKYNNVKNVVWATSKDKRFNYKYQENPAPGKYDISSDFDGTGRNFISKFKSSGAKSLLGRFAEKPVRFQTPGPGTYSTFSEFGYFEYKRPESLDVLNKAKSNGKREEKSS